MILKPSTPQKLSGLDVIDIAEAQFFCPKLSFHIKFLLGIPNLVEARPQKIPEYSLQDCPALDKLLQNIYAHIQFSVYFITLSPTHHLTPSLDVIFSLFT